MAEASILKSIKKALGLPDDYDVFDEDVIMHINTTLATLHQIGVGPDEGVSIEDDSTTWSELIEDEKTLNSVRTYVLLNVRLVFDPPATSFVIASYEKQIEQLAFRISVRAEEVRKSSLTT